VRNGLRITSPHSIINFDIAISFEPEVLSAVLEKWYTVDASQRHTPLQTQLRRVKEHMKSRDKENLIPSFTTDMINLNLCLSLSF